ncbi:16S rRNA (adenine(1518)-N(6)/adenine(1519)-N(6))-dimethyltransferase RsmA [Riemerella columbina]|uniref:16S rRNA (adenine(1518)-N(6)/adenine(1519)-N(6))- dimethyltransferase RsmA n=1 Tax=Riemerella columbina TaxID=103810 RepID=UPI0026702A0F|nr:16S rRNA (adenine(1518)-N(6)/adenine(1519)-N(6))-dimethyltransferase RsmA [Riemerella columbina]WKS95861.1 16S rRNA (adenine(1518)-N(6)/adenine(1519)-N(6))-dimethyltransferase RsmA [Riemerella columbina]
MTVKAKKYLGQHFLNDENIAAKIVNALHLDHIHSVLEVGPGMGVLTKYLLKQNAAKVLLAEIDQESIAYLKNHYPEALSDQNFVGDFLKAPLEDLGGGQPLGIIGNFPYNISSQILFKIIDHYTVIPEMVGMFQKEVAERVAAVPRTKSYGILSVLVQAYYEVSYLFTVHENVFTPPPKVKSGVIRMVRNPKAGLAGNEALFKQIVKAGFNQRRKKLSNALKPLGIPESLLNHNFLSLRAEELSVEDFIAFTLDWKNALSSS